MRQLSYWPLRFAAFIYRVIGVLSILATVYLVARIDSVVAVVQMSDELRYLLNNIALLLVVLVGAVVTLVMFTLAAHTDVLLNINDNLNRIINAIKDNRKQRAQGQQQQQVAPPTVIPVSTHHD